MPDTAAIETFLRKVDSSFPVALSQKQNLHSFAAKLHDKATLCVEFHNQKILGMVAGYIKTPLGIGRISLLLQRLKKPSGADWQEN